MIDREAFSPLLFFEFDHKPGTFCLILSGSHLVASEDVFAECGQHSNGYGWEDVARSALFARAPQLAGRLDSGLDFDSEAGMFCAFGEDADALAAVLGAKVLGAAHLNELLGERPLDAFVLFSSGAAAWGSGAQAGYAAANAFVDALAEDRRARGLAATSVAWGAWGGGGMVDAASEERLRSRGLDPMSPELGVLALRRAVECEDTTLVVAAVEWERFVPGFTAARPSPLIGDLPEVARLLAAQEAQDDTEDGAEPPRCAGSPP
ncbi:Imm51 family immunity protein [Kitasatospora sp. NPDC048298]|uniref:Imm51 family immunity protein n=1 Tax=Kitasatospora sp. NPDC048298 TaxID=3364049 RepID=UPI00371D0107